MALGSYLRMAVSLQPRRRGHSLFFTPVSDSTSSETATPSPTISRRRPKMSGSSSQLSSSLQAGQNSAVHGPSNVYRSSSSPLIYQDPREVYPPNSYSGQEGHRVLRPSHSQSHLQRSRSNSQQQYYQSFAPRPQVAYSRDSGSEDDEDGRPLLVTRSVHSPARRAYALVAPLSSIRTETMVSRKSAVEPADTLVRVDLCGV